MSSHEGRNVRLTWIRLPSGLYRAWVVGRPELQVEGEDWQAVSEELATLVTTEVATGEWSSDWDPPEPTPAEAVWSQDPDFVQLHPGGRFVLLNKLEDVMAGPICPICARHPHARNPTPLTVHIDILNALMSDFYSYANLPPLIRADAVSVFEENRLGTELRPTRRLGNGKIEALEPHPHHLIRPVAVRELTSRRRQCSTCGAFTTCNRLRIAQYLEVFDESHIPRSADAFWVGEAHADLCVRRDWWQTVRDLPILRGVLAYPLNTVPTSLVDPDPQTEPEVHDRPRLRGFERSRINYIKTHPELAAELSDPPPGS